MVGHVSVGSGEVQGIDTLELIVDKFYFFFVDQSTYPFGLVCFLSPPSDNEFFHAFVGPLQLLRNLHKKHICISLMHVRDI